MSVCLWCFFFLTFNQIMGKCPLLYALNDYLHSVNVWSPFVLLCPPRPHRVKCELSQDTGKAHSTSHDSGPLKHMLYACTLPVTLPLQR